MEIAFITVQQRGKKLLLTLHDVFITLQRKF